jgi:hypothetical protein
MLVGQEDESNAGLGEARTQVTLLDERRGPYTDQGPYMDQFVPNSRHEHRTCR